MLFNEPKLLKWYGKPGDGTALRVSVLFNEPKLLKSTNETDRSRTATGFSALQRAEIAEILKRSTIVISSAIRFSALQRAEIAEISPASVYVLPDAFEFQCSSTSRNC